MRTKNTSQGYVRFRETSLAAFICVLAILLTSTVNAQVYKLSTYDMKILGSSNVHDWTMKGKNVTCNASFVVKPAPAPAITSLTALEFSMPVKGLKSDHDLMDSRTYSTLKEDKNKTITFKLISAVLTPEADNKYTIKATGNLTIAGVTRQLVLTSNGVLNPDKTITVTGSSKIKMSEFSVPPPSFMFGAMKVGDLVTIQYNLKFVG